MNLFLVILICSIRAQEEEENSSQMASRDILCNKPSSSQRRITLNGLNHLGDTLCHPDWRNLVYREGTVDPLGLCGKHMVRVYSRIGRHVGSARIMETARINAERISTGTGRRYGRLMILI